MEYNNKLRIQYLLIEGYFPQLRRIKYRVYNKQLPWWRRNFIFNPWRNLFYTDVSGNTHEWFDKWQYDNELKPLKTLGEIRKYIAEQVRLIKEDDEWY